MLSKYFKGWSHNNGQWTMDVGGTIGNIFVYGGTGQSRDMYLQTTVKYIYIGHVIDEVLNGHVTCFNQVVESRDTLHLKKKVT